MTTTSFKICTPDDTPLIIDFLLSVKDDFPGFDRQAVEDITRLLFDKGGVLAGFKRGQLIALLGYFLGEPARNYSNEEVGFLYLAALAKSVRMTHVAYQGLRFTIQSLQAMGVREVRFHALLTDRYTNRMYARFARQLGEAESLRGDPTILYGASVDEVLAYLTEPKCIPAKRPTPDSYHQNSGSHRNVHRL